MLAVPNTFTRNQLEGRFRQAIEQELSGYFRRSMQLAVIVDEALTPGLAAVPDQNGSTRYADSRPRRRPREFGALDDVAARVDELLDGPPSVRVEFLRGGAWNRGRRDVTTSG